MRVSHKPMEKRKDLLDKIDIMINNNSSSPEENIIIKFMDLIEWGSY